MINDIKIGQQLWDLRYGRVSVVKLKGDYPIEVITEKGLTLYYDAHGYACISHHYPLLINLNEEFRLPKTHASLVQPNALAQKDSRPKK